MRCNRVHFVKHERNIKLQLVMTFSDDKRQRNDKEKQRLPLLNSHRRLAWSVMSVSGLKE